MKSQKTIDRTPNRSVSINLHLSKSVHVDKWSGGDPMLGGTSSHMNNGEDQPI